MPAKQGGSRALKYDKYSTKRDSDHGWYKTVDIRDAYLQSEPYEDAPTVKESHKDLKQQQSKPDETEVVVNPETAAAESELDTVYHDGMLPKDERTADFKLHCDLRLRWRRS